MESGFQNLTDIMSHHYDGRLWLGCRVVLYIYVRMHVRILESKWRVIVSLVESRGDKHPRLKLTIITGNNTHSSIKCTMK